MWWDKIAVLLQHLKLSLNSVTGYCHHHWYDSVQNNLYKATAVTTSLLSYILLMVILYIHYISYYLYCLTLT
jgi:hypothetical protein